MLGEEVIFGPWLKERRRALDLTQRALAERAGCSAETIKKIEAGLLRPSGQLAGLLAVQLQVAAEDRAAFVRWARMGTPAPPRVLLPEQGAPAAPPVRLPAPPTAFIGRAGQVAEVVALLREPGVRLLTLTGPAGIGKTRLALQVGGALPAGFPGGIFFVPLAALNEPALVASRIAQVLGLREMGGQGPAEILAEFLRPRRVLLLLDNFEQVLPARQVVADLLAAGPQVKILVTSRTLLHLYGEHEFPVPPLALPELHPLPPPDQLAEVEAIRLFVDRARAAQHDFALAPENAPAVAEICHRLDGLPLAIELAAAWIKWLTPVALRARLKRRLALLAGGPADLPARQRTLRAAISWSYDLLREDEQTLFCRLAVFQGGCTAAVAAGIADGPDPVDPPAERPILERLRALVDQSLLLQDRSPAGAPRFRMLETIREYALDGLLAGGEADAIRQRHVAAFLDLAEAGALGLAGPEQAAWLERLEVEHDNLRAALRWLLERGDGEGAARLGGALGRFWYLRAYFAEGRRWLQAALACHRPPAATGRATALHWAGVLAWSQGDYGEATALLDDSLVLRRAQGDPAGVAAVLTSLGAVALTQGAYEPAQTLFAESLALHRAAQDRPGIALALANLGLVRLDQGDYTQATTLLEESRALRRALGDPQSVAQCLNNLGIVQRCRGDYALARRLHEESLACFRALGDSWSYALALANLGLVRLDQGDPAGAARLLAESLTLFQAQGVKPGIATCLDGLAWVAGRQGRAARAARLAATAESLRLALGAPRTPPEEIEYRRHTPLIAASLPPAALTQAEAAGRQLSLEEAIALALAEE